MIRSRKLALWLTIPVLLILAGLFLVVHPPNSVRAVYTSPSGSYRLVVHSYYRLLAMPGDSTGASGYVELFDCDGKKVATSKIPLVLDVSSADDIRWYEHNVSVPASSTSPSRTLSRSWRLAKHADPALSYRTEW
jgi:hypothetical protein